MEYLAAVLADWRVTASLATGYLAGVAVVAVVVLLVLVVAVVVAVLSILLEAVLETAQ